MTFDKLDILIQDSLISISTFNLEIKSVENKSSRSSFPFFKKIYVSISYPFSAGLGVWRDVWGVQEFVLLVSGTKVILENGCIDLTSIKVQVQDGDLGAGDEKEIVVTYILIYS